MAASPLVGGQVTQLTVHHAGPAVVKMRLFEAFWNSGAALVGEEEAPGWAMWLSQGRQPAAAVPAAPEPAPPGAGGSLAHSVLSVCAN